MLGETQGTSAGGAPEARKSLGVACDLDVYLLDAGRVGGPADDERSIDVKPAVTSAIVVGIAERSVTGTEDPDFGYQVAVDVPGRDTPGVRQPRRLHGAQGRVDEYESIVEKLREVRPVHLAGYPDLEPEIAAAV